MLCRHPATVVSWEFILTAPHNCATDAGSPNSLSMPDLGNFSLPDIKGDFELEGLDDF
jgi:hypothetical protein